MVAVKKLWKKNKNYAKIIVKIGIWAYGNRQKHVIFGDFGNRPKIASIIMGAIGMVKKAWYIMMTC